jgi:hypothetical protein
MLRAYRLLIYLSMLQVDLLNLVIDLSPSEILKWRWKVFSKRESFMSERYEREE